MGIVGNRFRDLVTRFLVLCNSNGMFNTAKIYLLLIIVVAGKYDCHILSVFLETTTDTLPRDRDGPRDLVGAGGGKS